MTIVITGANRGIGAGLAEAYRARGEAVIAAARSGGDVTLDVTDPASVAALADGLGDRAVELLICNAGVYADKGERLADGFAPEMWAETFAVNVTGVFLTVQALVPHLARAAAPRIAIVSSQMGSNMRANGGSYIYRASKAAATNLGRNLARDLAPRGIAVGIYHPGWVRTDMGGSDADIALEESVAGLVARFDALSLETTGAFLTWDGREHPY
ncbi:SDR family oxidoreductase [Roseibacterium sp. SDUM158017]|uniref:SDR family oxidoreductase n=1 Tax=Roseicyclus salinarum TaxID=3036773 RepID=UPI002414ED99|nr:SDR family oxidoreductase [Roseibacterium sp. SDUM158017]MDG4648549.1 SDR family oxidoreductase [Roseibacterium sp. SDUM158017]